MAADRPHEVRAVTVAAQLTAVIRSIVAPSELARVVPACCGEVWEYARAAGLPRPGRHVAVYLDAAITLECGVEVQAPFTGNDRVFCSATPAGAAVTATLMGGYERLREVHHAIREWCAEHRVTLAGPSWEVYGHWADSPAVPRTDVFYLVRGA